MEAQIEIILIFSGIIAYTLKAMQPDGFLKRIPAKLKISCNPCIAGWFSGLLVFLYSLAQIYFEFLPFINPMMFLFIGALGHALYKYME